MFSGESLLFILAVVCLTFSSLWLKHKQSIVYAVKYTGLYAVLHSVALVIIPLFAFGLGKRKLDEYSRYLFQLFAKPLNIKWEIRGKEYVGGDEGIIVANHQSVLDLLGFAHVDLLIGKVRVVAKKEVFYFWPYGLWAYLIGAIFVDRENPKSAYKELDLAAKSMKKTKVKILLFPEGIRNRKPEFLPFKKGAFITAITAGVPIVPMIYSPFYFMNREKKIFNDGKIIVKFLKPISTTGLKEQDAQRLAEEVRQKMLDVFNELGTEILSTLPKNYPLEDKWRKMLPKTNADSGIAAS